MAIQVLNRHHFHGKPLPKSAVYIGRGTPLGNPFEITTERDRESAVTSYSAWMERRIIERDPVAISALLKLAPDAQVVCSCAPAACHGDRLDKLRAMAVQAIEAGHGQARKVYAGIGSRKTPPAIMRRMTKAASRLRELGFTLRSGAAAGADAAFEVGAGDAAEVFLPWTSFNQHMSHNHIVCDRALAIASVVHPAWHLLGEKARLLQARNGYQVLGRLLDSPVDFVLCWTEDGAQTTAERTRATGGTGQAIELATLWRIPVFNMARTDALDRLAVFLQQ